MCRNILRRPLLASLLLACGLLLAFSGAARADLPGEIKLERPGAREFVLDKAGLISPADQTKIKALADKLLTDKSVPIVVVTIEGMDKHGGAGLRIETFARLLFDQWGVGAENVKGQPWNYGMLLLVSKNDKKARIELGAGWRRDKDIAAQAIMQQQIIPRFRQGQFSAGIVAGVEALDRLARDLKSPAPAKTANTARPVPGATPIPPSSTHTSPPAGHRFGHDTPYRERSSGGGGWFLIIVLVVGLGLLFMVVSGIASLFRSAGGGGANYGGGGPGGNWGPGARSWGGGGGGGGIGSFLGGAAAGVLGSTLYGLMNQRSHANQGQYYGQDLWSPSQDHGATGSFDSGSSGFDSGSSFGGGSFGDSGSSFGGGADSGGGFSGGGGATGEW